MNVSISFGLLNIGVVKGVAELFCNLLCHIYHLCFCLLLKNCGLKMVSHFTVTISGLFWTIPLLGKMTITQIKFEMMSSNFRFVCINGWGTFGDKIKEIKDQRVWRTIYFH